MRMWGTFEKRLAIGVLALALLCFMVLQCVWQMWGHRHLPPDTSGQGFSMPMHRARHVLEPFSTNIPASFKTARDLENPFYPNPSQPPPPPPPVITRQVPLVYQGYYSTSQGEKRAYVMSGAQQIIGPVGTKVIAGYAISDISPASLTLADSAGKQIKLDFSVTKTIDIPL